jgi:hypothetical protein
MAMGSARGEDDSTRTATTLMAPELIFASEVRSFFYAQDFPTAKEKQQE